MKEKVEGRDEKDSGEKAVKSHQMSTQKECRENKQIEAETEWKM